MGTVAASRMTAVEAQAALAETEAALAKHADGCSVCQAARDGGAFRIWRLCAVGAEFVRVHLALAHRIHYLAAKARRKQTTEE